MHARALRIQLGLIMYLSHIRKCTWHFLRFMREKSGSLSEMRESVGVTWFERNCDVVLVDLL